MENENKKYKPLTDEHKSKIGDYLQSRFGCHGVNSYEFVWKTYDKRDYGTQKIKLKNTGILQYMLKELNLTLTVWGIEFPKTLDVGFSYDHQNGGSNGHDTNIKILVHEDGRIYEVKENFE